MSELPDCKQIMHFIEKGGDPNDLTQSNDLTQYGQSFLYVAIRYYCLLRGHDDRAHIAQQLLELITFLIQHGANVTLINRPAVNWPKTALSLWILMSEGEIAKLLIRHGGYLPLYYVTEFDDWSPDKKKRCKDVWCYFGKVQLRNMALALPDQSPWILMWISEYLSGMKCLTEYRKLQIITGIQQSVKKVREQRSQPA